eukprot:CAMPEP_0117051174 /NCGR_PEP_ID=MMETSP0472-20121206/35342_1 /TAXON_ID=693140 ORGANISM="Tiarina fusus, Strain LIS" /NCGR_SAMPLE_ID=MMETSP0472 /ASSEMBLY_ACC=CAM_ASM_000603 /LENGTH=51 /DNA_ID=CAMNT_0004765255 /DNA_START=9 /DNA_END=164 /DNA_ORIENTATION=+
MFSLLLQLQSLGVVGDWGATNGGHFGDATFDGDGVSDNRVDQGRTGNAHQG